MKVWLNGDFVSLEETNVSLLSHSFSRGSAVFEVLDVVNTNNGPALFGLQPHIDRFFNSVSINHMEIPLSSKDLGQAVMDTARINGVTKGIVKFMAYYPDIDFRIVPRDPKVSIAIVAFDFETFNVDPDALKKPVNAVVAELRKNHPESMNIHAKITGGYVSSYQAMMAAKKAGFDEVIFLDTMGYVAEGATCNLFMVIDGKLRTPTLRSVLSGITRKALIDVLRYSKTELIEEDIPAKKLDICTEAFFTSSVVKILPVRSINRRTLGEHCPGPVTNELLLTVAAFLKGEIETLNHWMTPF